jgi:hypothetical protein
VVPSKKNHKEKPEEEPPAAREPPAGEPFAIAPDGTFEGMPLVEVDKDALEYTCPWSDCGDTHQVPRKSAAYTTPCGHPLGFTLDGVLWIKPKRPAAHKQKPRNLQTLLGLRRDDPFAGLPYGKTNVRVLLDLWADKHGQETIRECLGWALFGRGQGIPHHQKVERAMVRVENVLRAEDRWDTILQRKVLPDDNEPQELSLATSYGAGEVYLSPGL